MNFALALLLLSAAGPQLQVETLNGSTLRGSLTELNDKQLIVETDGKSVTLPMTELQRIRLAAPVDNPKSPALCVELTDGSQVLTDRYGVSHGKAHFTVHGEAAEISTEKVASVRFKEQAASQAAEWSRIRGLDVAADLLVLRKADRIDYAKGVLEDADDKTVGFRLDNELIKVPRAKIEGLVYFHAARGALAQAPAVVIDSDGSKFQARRLVLADGTLSIETPAGLKIRRPLAAVQQIDFAVDKIVYLSDLTPATSEWSPFFAAGRTADTLAQLFRPRKDHSLVTSESAGDDGSLQLRFVEESGAAELRSFHKGLALHSRSRLVYALTDKFRRFKAIAGIDARLGNQGKVRLVIDGDGHELLALNIAGGEPPRGVDLDITGVRKLTLLVDYGDQSDVADYLNLCEARFVK